MRICPECGTETQQMVCAVEGRMTLDMAIFSADDPWKGKVVGRKYAMVSRIGAGGMGSVYRARHVETGGAVAVKLLHPQVALKPQMIKRFHLEAQNAASLQHVNTIRIVDFGVDAGSPFLVMEYLEGEPLSALLRREAPLEWPRAARIAEQVLSSLAEAHANERRIVHRDIKPANIFVMEQAGQHDFVKVLDFGISRSLESEGADTRGPIGTPNYMAPELWQGHGADARVDLYAVGCVLYEMLCGEPPFQADDEAPAARQMTALAEQHVNVQPAALSDRAPPGTPAALMALTHLMLAKVPDQRPQTAPSIIDHLTFINLHPGRSLSRERRSHRPSGVRRRHPSSHSTTVHVDGGGDDLITLDEVDPITDPVPGDSAPDGPASEDVTLAGEGAPGMAQVAASKPDETVSATPGPATSGVVTSGVATSGVATSRPTWRRSAPWVAIVAFAVLAGAIGWGHLNANNLEQQLALLRSESAPLAKRAKATRLLLDAPHKGLSLRATDLSQLMLSSRDLSEIDLQQARMDHTDLKKADLTGADLRRASLQGADLRGASLRLADLRGANLNGANLTGTGLKGSRYDDVTRWPERFDFEGSGAIGPRANLSGVDLRGADLRGASLADANLQRGRLKDANLGKANLRGANVRGARLVDAVLRDADLRDADLRGADLRGADLRGAKLKGIDLRGARYSKETRFPPGFVHPGAIGPKANLVKQDLRNQDLQGMDLRGADLRESRLQGADLRRARLAQARLQGARYDGRTRWPQGFDAPSAGALRQRAGRRADVPVPKAAPAAAPVVVVPGAAVPVVGSPPPVQKGKRRTRGARRAANRRRRAKAPHQPQPGSAPSEPLAAAAKPTTKQPNAAEPKRAPENPTPGTAAAETDGVKPALVPAPVAVSPALIRPKASDIVGRRLQGKDLRKFDLRGLDLRWTRYDSRTRWPAGFNPRTSGAVGPKAKLAGRVLRRAQLAGMDLRGVDLRRADLRRARLLGVQLQGADLRGALLHGADLRQARLNGAKLQGARYDSATRWPAGFVPADHGAKLQF
ncbi:MAG: pentapeptide repeat-containing protein [Myxococcales bacterium]|nr:pentapeptide repeat-containing protein [Myxococcales bacterium]